jgi:hypothetical protein
VTPDQEERIVVAFESAASALIATADATRGIADALELLAMTNDARFAVEHPPKQEPREMKVTRLPTEEDLIREQHGGEDDSPDGPGSPLDRWTTLGPREARWEATRDEKGAADQGDGAPRADGTGTGKVRS